MLTRRYLALAAVLLPCTLGLVWRSGTTGAALANAAFHVGQFAIIVPAAFSEYLRGELLKWLSRDVVMPLFFPVLFLASLAAYDLSLQHRPTLFVEIGVLFAGTLSVTALATPLSRNLITSYLRRLIR